MTSPARTPCRERGSVTRKKAPRALAPRSRAASSTWCVDAVEGAVERQDEERHVAIDQTRG